MAMKPKASFFTSLSIMSLLFLVGFYLVLLTCTYFQYHPASLLNLITTPEIRHAISMSILCATAATVLALMIAVPASYVLSRKNFRGKIFIDAILDIPVFVSPVALGALLLVFFTTPVGKNLQDQFFPVVFALPGIIVAQFTVIAGLAARLMKATFDQIPTRYEEVARTLGCTHLQAFLKVTLPLAKNGIVAATIVSWARAMGEFGATITLVGAAPMKTETIPTAVYLSFAGADVDRALTMVAILILTALIGLLVIRIIAGKAVPF
jgi:molybdate transport system permease protein